MAVGGSSRRIESLTNHSIRAYRALATGKGRRERGRFQLEGLTVIAEALRAGIRLSRVYWCPQRVGDPEALVFVEDLKTRTEVVEVTEHVLEHMASTVTPQPILAEAPILERRLADIRIGGSCLIVAAFETRDPGNLGTIVRTAHAMAATAVVGLGNCVDVYSPKVVRATMGSLFHVPVVRRISPAEFVQWCEATCVRPFAAIPRAANLSHNVSFPSRTAILLGGETRGLPEELLDGEITRIAIEMPGGAESLNVAVSAAILMYEYRRQHPVRKT